MRLGTMRNAVAPRAPLGLVRDADGAARRRQRIALGRDQVQVVALVDPTLAYHERLYLYSGNEVVDCWPIDLRGW
jgi:hypothetical protein